MFTGTSVFIVLGIALAGVIIGVAVALILWYLVALTYREVLEFVDVYKGERRKCMDEDDILFSEWVEQFQAEPLSMMREYADAN